MQETTVSCLPHSQIHEWARPLAIDFDWSGFYSLLYARTGWRDVFFLAHTGVVCGNPHDKALSGQDPGEAEPGHLPPVLADPFHFGPPAPPQPPASARRGLHLDHDDPDPDGGPGPGNPSPKPRASQTDQDL